MTTITRYPLCWPVGWKRTLPERRRTARFGRQEMVASSFKRPDGSYDSYPRRRRLTVADAVRRVSEELTRLGAHDDDRIVSTNIPVRLDGLPRSEGLKRGEDPGVAVYWQRPGEPQRCMAIDLYDNVADNLAAIAATLEAMRAIERHGGAVVLDRAFSGFDALPPPGARKTWREVLGIPPDVRDLGRAREAYRRLASAAHPDKGGSHAQMSEVNLAWAEAQEALSGG